MKRLINALNVRDVLFREEKKLAKMMFNTKEYPVGFITGVQDSINIANIIYARSQEIESAIKEVQERILNMPESTVKSGYWFILSYLHYMNNDVVLSMVATKCIIACYKNRVTDNDWYNIFM